MADQKVNIDIKTRGAKKSKQDISGLSTSISSLGRSALNAGAAYFGTRGLIQGLMESTRLAGVQEQAEKSLEVALGKRSQALLDQASALQKVTTFGDESIIGVQASIAAFVDSEEQIKKATEATLDIAVAMGMDLKSAGDLVAKTLGSSTNAMSRYGIEVKGAVGSTERLESLTGNVAKLFGGQASAQAQTYAGSVEQLKNQLGDMGEQIGRIVIPVFEKLAPHLKTAINFWSTYLDVGHETEIQTTKYTKQLNDLNEQIDYQKGLIEGVTSANIGTNDVTEKGINLIIRANDQGRTAIEQLREEKIAIGELVAERFNLIASIERENEIKEAVSIRAFEEQEIRKAGNDVVIESVKNNGLAVMANQRTAKSYLEMVGSTKTFAFAVSSASQLNRKASHRNALVAKRAAQVEAVVNTASAIAEVLPNIPLSIAMGALGAIQIAKIEAAKFADGGIVQGDPSKGDAVPALLTAGELILNASQQQGLLNNMGGVTVNIQGNMIGNEEFVRDTLIPEIDKTVNRGLA